MQYELKFKCKDILGTWESNLCLFAENDKHAISEAKESIKYLNKRFPDITFSEIKLFENVLQDTKDYSILFKDRFICTFI